MERKLFVLDLTSAWSEIVVFDLRSVKRQPWSSFSPLSVAGPLSLQVSNIFEVFTLNINLRYYNRDKYRDALTAAFKYVKRSLDFSSWVL